MKNWKTFVLLFDENLNNTTATITDIPANLQVLKTLASNIDLSTHNPQQICIQIYVVGRCGSVAQ